MAHPKVKVLTPALRTIGNIVTGTDAQTQAALEAKVMVPLVNLLANSARNIRKEACWTISNITAGTAHQINNVLRHQAIPALVRILNTDVLEVKKEAAYAVSNVTSGGNDDQKNYLIKQKVVEAICTLLDEHDPKIISLALEALNNLLDYGKKVATEEGNPVCDIIEECGGLDRLEDLQQHENQDIYTRSVNLVREYFECEDEVDATLAPTVESTGNQFAFGTSGGAPVSMGPQTSTFGANTIAPFTFQGKFAF